MMNSHWLGLIKIRYVLDQRNRDSRLTWDAYEMIRMIPKKMDEKSDAPMIYHTIYLNESEDSRT